MDNASVSLTAADGGSFTAYLARPSKPNGAAVVVLQEIFGINANIRGIADDFADEGFVAIAPDLFWRQEPNVELNPASESDRERATALLKGLDQQAAVADALVAASYARELPEVTGKVGAVGYCLGGKLAFLLAGEPGIDAAVSYYGVMIQAALDRVPAVRAKLLLHIAEDDHLCPPEAQQAIRVAADAAADRIEIMSYPGVGHAFARRDSQPFNASAAERADAATLALLRSELGAG
ncbi:dienelactone hydrolase family protein [Novosphingobium sp. RL4]|uniref:dienelactone hydrolase family protein n=1 Tax=Novosphingobium sp. RL4 TaxID=3109595 RepID=UPI002D78F9DA|nr:dienelactone hydrolase family protein [Novosphingobium sp. RL4]WRT94425.1 dienelactone hydrolase family protein [Novosphingobium sp. RL4]